MKIKNILEFLLLMLIFLIPLIYLTYITYEYSNTISNFSYKLFLN